jgi:hypothetical protein
MEEILMMDRGITRQIIIKRLYAGSHVFFPLLKTPFLGLGPFLCLFEGSFRGLRVRQSIITSFDGSSEIFFEFLHF